MQIDLLPQVDANTSFLRAARAGELDKIIDFLERGEVTDINASNAVSYFIFYFRYKIPFPKIKFVI